MNDTLQNLLREATRLTRSGRLNDATDAIQRALRGLGPALPATPVAARAATTDTAALVLDGCVFEADAGVETEAELRPGVETFSAGTHTHAGQTRAYKLCVPPGAAGRALPLVVMLHGCTQDPDDFAAGTGMNQHAREQGFFVLYPAQPQAANPSRCWNWFQPGDQQRGSGEPAWLADLTRAVIARHGIDPRRVYVAGLSAGGAMAAIAGAAYPDLFAAVGVHSGLACGAATSLPQALAAMKSGSPGRATAGVAVPTIVFHGDRDRTVHPRNGEQVIAAAVGGRGTPTVEPGVSARGRRYTRSIHPGDAGRAQAEHWVVHGAGHAWSGGHTAGSYTDAKGPDATREMLRFFFEHSLELKH